MILTLKVVPKSSKNTLGWYDKEAGILKVNITAPPVDGKANKKVIEFLAKSFGVKKNRIAIKSGETSKLKQVEIEAEEAAVRNTLSEIE
jgi:uncharacterized protein (TIGR00251 family)